MVLHFTTIVILTGQVGCYARFPGDRLTPTGESSSSRNMTEGGGTFFDWLVFIVPKLFFSHLLPLTPGLVVVLCLATRWW